MTNHGRAPIGALIVVLTLACLPVSCGKVGPPLPPLRLVPNPAPDLAARRSAQQVELRFGLPTTNANGPGTVDLDHVEIYAMTIGAHVVTPPNRELLTKPYVVGTLAVKPPPVEGEQPVPGAAPDTRPAPGDHVTFVEELTEAKLKPVPRPVPPAGAKVPAAVVPTSPETPATGAPPVPIAPPGAEPTLPVPVAAAPDAPPAVTPAVTPAPPATVPAGETPTAQPPAGAPPVAAAPAVPGQVPAAQPAVPPVPPVPVGLPYPVRIYVVRGISKNGRPGPASARVTVPLVSPVSAPTGVLAQMPTENAVTVVWTAPVAEPGATALTFNVYSTATTTTKPAPTPAPAAAPPAAPAALNTTPLTEPKFELTTVEYGKELCVTVRAIQTMQNVTIESEPSAPGCLTPRDTFPPVAPKGLRAIAEDGAINLVWDPNSESDFAGYLVLRGEGEGATLQRLSPQLVKDASYRDTSVKAGVRYVYAVVAVDTATPANQSARSAQESVTAR